MNEPIPMRSRPEPERLTSYQAMKVLGFFVILLGPVLPLTVFLWRLAVGG